jgi:hypothetical protein
MAEGVRDGIIFAKKVSAGRMSGTYRELPGA